MACCARETKAAVSRSGACIRGIEVTTLSSTGLPEASPIFLRLDPRETAANPNKWKSMRLEEFRNYARLYVIGALESEETKRFEVAREQYGPAAEAIVEECNRLHEALRLSLKPAEKVWAINTRLLSMISRRNPNLLRWGA